MTSRERKCNTIRPIKDILGNTVLDDGVKAELMIARGKNLCDPLKPNLAEK